MSDARILFVCLGNICRSPAAEGVARSAAGARGISVKLDSAGTGDWHVGRPPDRRMQAAAAAAGYDLSSLRARVFRPSDFHEFDVIYAMDRQNLADIERLKPADATARAVLFRASDTEPGSDVPDPYFEGNFGAVLRLIERNVARILDGLA